MKFFVILKRCLHVMECGNRDNAVDEQGRYVRLLYLLIIIISIPNMLMDKKGILSIIFTCLLIAVLLIKNLSKRKKPFHLYLFISIVAFLSDVSYMGNSEHKFTSDIQIISDILQFIFTFFVLYLISREIFQKEKITKDAVAGGLCIYLLLGNVWSLLYANLHLFEGDAFHGPGDVISSFDFLYFSFATFTSTGYGDIVPVSIMAKSFASAEAVVGILLPAVFISRLVGLYGESDHQLMQGIGNEAVQMIEGSKQESVSYRHGWYFKIVYVVIVVLSILNILSEEKGIFSIIFVSFIMILLIIMDIEKNKEPFHLYLSVSIIAFISDVSYMDNSDISFYSTMQVIADMLYFVFTCYAVYLISREIFQKEKITKDAVAGGLCIYLLVGNAWSLMYANLYLFDQGAFHAPNGAVSSFDFLYFSFTTFTSTGYGDFLPVSIVAKSFTIAESIMGVLLPAVFISRLVELYGKGRRR